MIPQVIICKTCKGTGIVEHRKFEGHSRGWEMDRYTCPECNGTGRKIRIITISETAFNLKK